MSPLKVPNIIILTSAPYALELRSTLIDTSDSSQKQVSNF
jgi:hypothetical protein